MALSSKDRERLLKTTLPESEAVARELRDYLARTGLELTDFARRVNYSYCAVRFFLAGRYHNISGNDAQLRLAIREFIQSHPIAAEQELESGTVYPTESTRLLRRYFYTALDKGHAYYIYGPPGTQKTFGLQHLIADLNRTEIAKNGHGRRAGYVYCRAAIRPTDLLKRVAEAFGVIQFGNADRILRNFRFDLRGRRVLVVFDEAQHLDINCLETVRELFDRPPHCGLLFAGSHNLKQIFQQVELEQWRRRLNAGKALPGLSEDEAREIIASELGPQKEKKIADLIATSRTPDPRQGREYSYISAGNLFGTLREIKTAMSEQKEATA